LEEGEGAGPRKEFFALAAQRWTESWSVSDEAVVNILDGAAVSGQQGRSVLCIQLRICDAAQLKPGCQLLLTGINGHSMGTELSNTWAERLKDPGCAFTVTRVVPGPRDSVPEGMTCLNANVSAMVEQTFKGAAISIRSARVPLFKYHQVTFFYDSDQHIQSFDSHQRAFG
jgi:hypothetical protein